MCSKLTNKYSTSASISINRFILYLPEEVPDVKLSENEPRKKHIEDNEQDDRLSDNSYGIPSPIFQDEEYIICETCKDSFNSMVSICF